MRGQSNHSSRFIEMFETTVHVYKEVPITALCHTDDDIKCGPFGTQLKQSEYQENGVAVWGIPQINSGFTIAPDTFVTPEKAKKLEQFSLISGDIAMSRKGNVGQCALYPDNFEKGIIASDVVRIRVNKDLIMPQFLVYQLHNSYKVRQQILNVSDGSIMAGINVTKLKKIHVYSTPLERQKQFVSIVKQSDKSKFTNFKSRFISQFGNLLPSHTIGEVAEVYDGTHQTPNYVNEGIRFVSVEDINDLYNSTKFISEADYQKYKHVPTVGDIIMTRIGSIGKCAIVDREEPLAYYVSVSLLKLNHEMIDSRYLKYYLESDFGDKELKLRSLLKAFPMKINLKEIPQVRLILPEIAEQIKFVDVVKQADKSKYLS